MQMQETVRVLTNFTQAMSVLKFLPTDNRAYNTRGYFARCVVLFLSPLGLRKNTIILSFQTLNHRVRDLLFHYYLLVYTTPVNRAFRAR